MLFSVFGHFTRIFRPSDQIAPQYIIDRRSVDAFLTFFFHDIECFYFAENSNYSVTSRLHTSFVCKHHGIPKPGAFFHYLFGPFLFRNIAELFLMVIFLAAILLKTTCFFSILLTVVLDNDSLVGKELYFTRIFSRLVLGSFNTSLTNIFSVFPDNFGGRPVDFFGK